MTKRTKRPRLVDLFCGAGGASKGYDLAGFEVVGVDLYPQPNYPFEFHQADALTFDLDGFDYAHASPPCQFATAYRRRIDHVKKSPNLIPATRARIAHLPYVIENVATARAELKDPLQLCGSSFGLDVRRHRLFESNMDLSAPAVRSRLADPSVPAGHQPHQPPLHCRGRGLADPDGRAVCRHGDRLDGAARTLAGDPARLHPSPREAVPLSERAVVIEGVRILGVEARYDNQVRGAGDIIVDVYGGGKLNICGTVRFKLADQRALIRLRYWARCETLLTLVAMGAGQVSLQTIEDWGTGRNSIRGTKWEL